MKLFNINVDKNNYRRLSMGAMMLAADLAGFSITGLVVILLNLKSKLFVFDLNDIKYLMIPLICLVLFTSSKLYPGSGMNPVNEMKLVFQNTGLSFLLGAFFFQLSGLGLVRFFWALPLTWALCLSTILIMRWGIRIVSVRKGVWGEPVAVIARGEKVAYLVKYFQNRHRFGFIPKIAIVPNAEKFSLTLSVPVVNLKDITSKDAFYFTKHNIETAMIDMGMAGQVLIEDQQHSFSKFFSRFIFFVDLGWLGGASIQTYDFESLIGIEARRNIPGLPRRIVKRLMDIFLALTIGLFFLPLLLMITTLILLEGKGSAIYTQKRVGHKGKIFHLFKFRTMTPDAEKILADYLSKNPDAQDEWNHSQKLKNDPRITRVGKWLRRYSLDELPQLLNILRGEMSLVGPRPMMVDQMDLYGDQIEIYYSMRPGMTGLWQVSGRNNITFKERTRFDAYYVRNWSTWLDIYIIIRTFWVVLNTEGAY